MKLEGRMLEPLNDPGLSMNGRGLFITIAHMLEQGVKITHKNLCESCPGTTYGKIRKAVEELERSGYLRIDRLSGDDMKANGRTRWVLMPERVEVEHEEKPKRMTRKRSMELLDGFFAARGMANPIRERRKRVRYGYRNEPGSVNINNDSHKDIQEDMTKGKREDGYGCSHVTVSRAGGFGKLKPILDSSRGYTPSFIDMDCARRIFGFVSSFKTVDRRYDRDQFALCLPVLDRIRGEVPDISDSEFEESVVRSFDRLQGKRLQSYFLLDNEWKIAEHVKMSFHPLVVESKREPLDGSRFEDIKERLFCI